MHPTFSWVVTALLQMHTGEIEVLGATSSLILEDRTLSTRYELFMDNGTLSTDAL